MQKNKGILVFGSFNYDMTARVERFPQPGETVLGKPLLTGPGGKGCNQAIAAHRAGGCVTFITKVGMDIFGDVAFETCKKAGLSAEGILRDPDYPTGSANILLEETRRQNMIVVNEGACRHFTQEDVDKIFRNMDNAGYLLTQMETNIDALEQVIRRSKESGLEVILNPAPAIDLHKDLYSLIDLITPNETEAETLTGIPVTCVEKADEAAAVFLARGVKQVVITMGESGVYVHDGYRSSHIKGYQVKALDTTGAGDCFNGALAAALSTGMPLMDAAAFANAAASISVTRLGAGLSAPTLDEIQQILR